MFICEKEGVSWRKLSLKAFIRAFLCGMCIGKWWRDVERFDLLCFTTREGVLVDMWRLCF